MIQHKSVMTGVMEGAGRKGRPCREWIEDIEDWCQTDVYTVRLCDTDCPRPRSVEKYGDKQWTSTGFQSMNKKKKKKNGLIEH